MIKKEKPERYEVLMSQHDIIKLINETSNFSLVVESKEDVDYSIKKKEYNKKMLTKIKLLLNSWVKNRKKSEVKIKLKQKVLFLLVFEKGLPLAVAAKKVGVSYQAAWFTINMVLDKIKNNVKYGFKPDIK